MSRLLRAVLWVGLAAGLAFVVQRLAAERAPHHGLNGAGHVAGSLDTWPPVPDNPAAAAHN